MLRDGVFRHKKEPKGNFMETPQSLHLASTAKADLLRVERLGKNVDIQRKDRYGI